MPQTETLGRVSSGVAALIRDEGPGARERALRVKDIYLCAFLGAHGHLFLGYEEVVVERRDSRGGSMGSPRTLIYFVFRQSPDVSRLVGEYSNSSPACLNVNASAFHRCYQQVRTVISNPIF